MGGGGGGGKKLTIDVIEEAFNSKLKSWSSNLLERDFCETGRDSTLTLTASCCETKLLKISTALLFKIKILQASV